MGRQVSDWPTGNILRELNLGTTDEPRDRAAHVFESSAPRSVFNEGLAIDYKWFDKWDIEPRWEFGFGMRCVSLLDSSDHCPFL